MDEFHPEKKVGMVMDKWGTQYDVKTGTNPGFLYTAEYGSGCAGVCYVELRAIQSDSRCPYGKWKNTE